MVSKDSVKVMAVAVSAEALPGAGETCSIVCALAELETGARKLTNMTRVARSDEAVITVFHQRSKRRGLVRKVVREVIFVLTGRGQV